MGLQAGEASEGQPGHRDPRGALDEAEQERHSRGVLQPGRAFAGGGGDGSGNEGLHPEFLGGSIRGSIRSAVEEHKTGVRAANIGRVTDYPYARACVLLYAFHRPAPAAKP